MKKIFAVLALVAVAFSINAQTSTPRFGIVPGDDNTGRVITYKYIPVTSTQTITITPNASVTYIKVAGVATSVALKVVTTKSFYGDQLIYDFQNGSTVQTITPSSSYTGVSSFTVGVSNDAHVEYQWNNTKWIQKSLFTH